MITYNSKKINEISKELTKILLNNNINIDDPEQHIDDSVLNLLIDCVHNSLEPVNKFINIPCPKCSNTHLVPMHASYSRNVIFKSSRVENFIK